MRSSILFAVVVTGTTAAAIPNLHGWSHKWDHLPLVNSNEFQKSIKAPALINGARKLQEFSDRYPEKNRVTGGKAHNDTLAYIKRELERLGDYYTITEQPYSNLFMSSGSFKLTIDGNLIPSAILEYSPSTNVTAPIALSGYGDVRGKIALAPKDCEYGLISALAHAAGAVGVLIYLDSEGSLYEGSLRPPGRPEGPYAPATAVVQSVADALIERIDRGETVHATLDIETVIETRYTHNLIATSKVGSKDTILMLGAHSDSVLAGPGVNDDGSGIIGILEVAKQLAKYKINNAVRFAFWIGEEQGILGSDYYTNALPAAELAKIRAYLNFDMIASPNYLYCTYDGDGVEYGEPGPVGSTEIERWYQHYFNVSGEYLTFTDLGGSSDYHGFTTHGIPVGGLFTGARGIKTADDVKLWGGVEGVAYDKNYHTATDTVDQLNMKAFEFNVKAVAASVAEYAISFDTLPPKAPAKKRAASIGRASKEDKARKSKITSF